MKLAYRILAGLIVLGVVVQAASIAYAAFAVSHAVDGGATYNQNSTIGDAGFGVHGINGQMVIPFLAIVLFIVSFFAKLPGGVAWAGYILLDTAVQVALGFISHGVPAIGWLHGLNALILFILALYATTRVAAAARRAPAPAEESLHGTEI